jgi:hypothetical protein
MNRPFLTRQNSPITALTNARARAAQREALGNRWPTLSSPLGPRLPSSCLSRLGAAHRPVGVVAVTNRLDRSGP